MLFATLFSAQACLVVLSPILSEVAVDLGATVAAVGQLRSISGAVAAAVALVVAAPASARWRRAPWRRRDRGGPARLRELLTVGLALLAAGSILSAVARSFALLAAAQAVLGVGIALTLTGGLTATARWFPPRQQARALSWTLLGQPAAWVVGLPIVGVLGELSWRLAWLVPLAAAGTALLALLRHAPDAPGPDGGTGPVPRQPGGLRWAFAELLAYGGWTAVLVYAGVLFTDGYEAPTAVTGLLLGLGALAYVPGNILARRWAQIAARTMAIALALAMAAGGLILCVARLSPGFSLAAFAIFAFLGGARSMVGSALGLNLGAADPLAAMSVRTASVQFGYLAGAGLGGVALAMAGWNGVGMVLALLLVSAAAVLAPSTRHRASGTVD